MEWIKVEDDLPVYGKMVLVYLGRKYAYCGLLKKSARYRKKDSLSHYWSFYNIGKRLEVETNNADFVTHWMNIPKPPMK